LRPPPVGRLRRLQNAGLFAAGRGTKHAEQVAAERGENKMMMGRKNTEKKKKRKKKKKGEKMKKKRDAVKRALSWLFGRSGWRRLTRGCSVEGTEKAAA
jgi:hypothetical protein